MDTKKFGQFIARKRKEKKLTQVQMGELLGVTGKTISRWENGNYLPDIALLIPITEILDITLNELLNGECAAEFHEKDTLVLVTKENYTKEEKVLKWKRHLSIGAAVFSGMAGVWILLHMIFFAKLPAYPGDTSKWNGLFQEHSAYELELTERNKPVFVNPDKAFAKAKSDYSDAIAALAKEYDLLPFSRYTSKLYRQYCNMLESEDVRVSQQLIGLADFFEVYYNSFEWKNIFLVGFEEYHELIGEEEVFMTEAMQNAVVLILVTLSLGLGALGYSAVFYFEMRKFNRLQGITEGKVIGLLKSHLFKNETYGEFPTGVLIGWGVARGEQYWGGTLKMDIPPWFPCVKFEVDGMVYYVISGSGTLKDRWKLEDTVTVLYDLQNPRVMFLEGDISYVIRQRIYMVIGIILLALCVVEYALVFV